MNIQLLSDLHLETQPSFEVAPLPDADLLILAGDIGSYPPGTRLPDGDFGLARFSPRHGWPTPVWYLPGNHEYDHADFDTAHARLRALCDTLDIGWLDRATPVIDGVRLVGTTLWADFDALAEPDDPPAVRETKRAQSMRAADRYLQTTGTTRAGRPFMAAELREEGLACRAWLRDALAQPFDGPTVAVTHFAPTLASADPRYGVTPATAGFCSRYDDLLPLADVWLHGHLHCAFDYMKDGCRVVANPLGYAADGEKAGFRPDLLIELPAAA